jgi:hypothetical protein
MPPPPPHGSGGARNLAHRSSLRNLRLVASTDTLVSAPAEEAKSAPAADAPVAEHIAYFRQRPRAQPPWFSAAIARAGEVLGGDDENAVWVHNLVTSSISGWLMARRPIGTAARGAFQLTPAALVERIVPLLGRNSTSNEQYIAYVRICIPTFDGRQPANFQFWRNSLQGVVQLEQLTPAFIGQIMINALPSSGEAYGVIIYSRFVRKAETHRLTLIPSDTTPASWVNDEPEDAYDTRMEAIQPPPPTATLSQPLSRTACGAATRNIPSWRAYLPHGPSSSALDNLLAVLPVLSTAFSCIVVLCDDSFVSWRRTHTLVIEGSCLHRLGRSRLDPSGSRSGLF